MTTTHTIGDCRIVLREEFGEGEFDACVTDPPYGLEFMGKEWNRLQTAQFRGDTEDWQSNHPNNHIAQRITKMPRYFAGVDAQNWHYLWAKEVYRVLKPGGYLLAFGGTRTYHRMVCAVEDAGFEIRDTIGHICGSGFPKSLNAVKQLWKSNKEWLSKKCVQFVEQNSRLFQVESSGEREHIALASAVIQPEGERALLMQIGKGDGSSVLTVTSQSISEMGNIDWNTISSWKGTSAEDCIQESKSITRIELETIIDSKIWSYLMSPTIRNTIIPRFVTHPDGWKLPVSTVVNDSSDLRSKSKHIPTLSALEGATFREQLKRQEGIGSALKPAIELIVVARKPFSERNMVLNIECHGVGGLNIDDCRILTNEKLSRPERRGFGNVGNWHDYAQEKGEYGTPQGQGRFSSNLTLECICSKVEVGGLVGNGHVPKRSSGAGGKGIYRKYEPVGNEERYLRDRQIIHTNPNCPCYLLDEQSGELSSGHLKPVPTPKRNVIYGKYNIANPYGDYEANKGGASRFFYVAKASRAERWFYCHVCNKAYSGDKRDNHKKHSMKCLDCGVDYEPKFATLPGQTSPGRGMIKTADSQLKRPHHFEDEHKSHNTKSNLLFHVTQKPVELIRYLIRLVTPKGGKVLDPLAGVFTTGVAARYENVDCHLIEIDEMYSKIGKARLDTLPTSIYDSEEDE